MISIKSCGILFLLLTVFQWTALYSKTRRYTAKGYNQETGKYLFKAKYREYWKKGKHITTKIEYIKNKEKKRFSIKRINFVKSLTVPDITYRELETGYFYTVKKQNSKKVTLAFLKDTQSKQLTNTVTVYKDSIADEGSHYFIMKNWSKLLKGDIVNFKFISSPKQNYYSFIVQKEKETKRSVTFVLRASALIIKLIAKPIRVTYDKRSKRIISYQGLTNLHENSKIIYADIFYYY